MSQYQPKYRLNDHGGEFIIDEPAHRAKQTKSWLVALISVACTLALITTITGVSLVILNRGQAGSKSALINVLEGWRNGKIDSTKLTQPLPESPLLTPEAIAANAKDNDLKFEEPEYLDDQSAGHLHAYDVVFDIDEPVTVTIHVAKLDNHWLVQTSDLLRSLQFPIGQPKLINQIEVNGGAIQVLPGKYVMASGLTLTDFDPQQATLYVPSANPPSQMPQLKLTEGSDQKVRDAIQATIDGCAASTGADNACHWTLNMQANLSLDSVSWQVSPTDAAASIELPDVVTSTAQSVQLKAQTTLTVSGSGKATNSNGVTGDFTINPTPQTMEFLVDLSGAEPVVTVTN